jgi:c(7)-type cytochrome triheme protein
MRAATAIVIALVLGLVGLVGAQPKPTREGFDHYIHDRNVSVSGADPIACTSCHTMKDGKLVGVPGHTACFGACHGAIPGKLAKKPAPITEPPERMRICTACHSEAALAAPTKAALAPGYPPYELYQDYALEAPHKRHAAVACGTCHTKIKTSAPHARCLGCHDGSAAAGKGPAMTACAGCHSPASGKPEPLAMLRTKATQIFVTKTFSHDKHAKRGGAGATCTTCHAAVLTTDDRQLPRVPMASCGVSACHDGKAAFATSGPCTKCHQEEPAERYDVVRPPDRFGHARPEHVAANLPCSACHTLSATGEPRVASHAACAGCHEADFAARVPETCGACHNATEPWRHLVPDREPPARSELGSTLDHGKHAQVACTACHSLATPTAELRPPRGHKACSGAACHANTGGASPVLTACEACHQPGLAVRREQARLTTPWSVRAEFSHAPHTQAPCATCHTNMAGATVMDIAAPAKATCVGCHDGKTAFKVTGTACTRCHPGSK